MTRDRLEPPELSYEDRRYCYLDGEMAWTVGRTVQPFVPAVRRFITPPPV